MKIPISTKVFKIGGNVLENAPMAEEFCRRFASVHGPKILVHGGGVMASELQKALGQTPVKIEGRRVTDADALKAVTMTYAGWCNKSLVATLQKYGCNAIGLAGCDANVITASKRAPRTLSDGTTVVDYGFVGDVKPSSINKETLTLMLTAGLTPVLCAINHDGNGQLLNTNADTVAASVAAALKAELVCCFELDGVLYDKEDSDSVIPVIREKDFEEMKACGVIADGMIPKIENCIEALKSGATSATIKNAMRIDDASGTTISL